MIFGREKEGTWTSVLLEIVAEIGKLSLGFRITQIGPL